MTPTAQPEIPDTMKSNLTSPRYQGTVDLRNPIDLRFLRMGILRLSPGQWVTCDGVTKARFVRLSKAGDPWVTHGTNANQFRLACKLWLAA